MSTTYEKMKYGYRDGGSGIALNLTGIDPQVVGDELENIRRSHNGRLFPPDVVESARSERSPLHNIFEWDDGKAASNFRLNQGRKLIKVVFIEAVESIPLDKPVSAFVNVRVIERVETPKGEPPKTRSVQFYDSTVNAMQDTEKREYVLSKAMRELETWRDRYEAYEEFSQVFAAIGTTKKKLALEVG